ncbi:CyP450 monooxygenase [Epithele typhae]|uniref:CyP450 monooxygenase n=1 Tax=Epithele typhae TaxID=378194 RepID=UPI002007E8EA|nr:CyP450 monooxygenase [Epithele typhae]KAH9937813.1 CyP450 monooxygenase [Epithele typhae]
MSGPGILAVFALGVALFFASRPSRRGLPLPPGPPRLPFIGNALDIPKKDAKSVFRDLCAKYGDVIHLDALGMPIIVLGSHEAAVELLEKRGANYCDTMPLVMVELCGLDWVLPLMRYGPSWRKHRRALHEFFAPAALDANRASTRADIHRFLLDLLHEPDSLVSHIRALFGSMIMRISYGFELDAHTARYLRLAEAGVRIFSAALVPGKYLVESLPFLRHLPAWAPGARFKRLARAWRTDVRRALEVPFAETVRRAEAGDATGSIAQVLHERARTAEDEELAKNVAAIAYTAGGDTTMSSAQWFFFAMAAHPTAQARAQAELDAVVGPVRLPELADERALPYVCALVRECLRWRSVIPLNTAHRALEEDEYRGCRIPKGAMVVANLWAFCRDLEVYPDPETFRPERFLKDGRLDPDVRDPRSIVFGYGRRECPGKAFAERSLFLLMATALHTLSITAPVSEDGQPVPMDAVMTEGVLSYPEPFRCVIKPRSKAAENLLRASGNKSLP